MKPGAQATRFQSADFQTGMGNVCCGWAQLTSMSRMLWVWVFRRLEGVHREVALQRPLLAAPQGYLRSQSASAYLVGEHSHYPRAPLYFLKQALQHVRCAYASMMVSG